MKGKEASIQIAIISSSSGNFSITIARLEFHKKLFSFVPRQTIGSMYLKMHLNFIWTLKLSMSALLCSIKLINLRLTYDMNLLYYPTHSASYFSLLCFTQLVRITYSYYVHKFHFTFCTHSIRCGMLWYLKKCYLPLNEFHDFNDLSISLSYIN